jgi:hypothetical protein
MYPKNWVSHQGAFSSHYDQGRITRVLNDDVVWAKLALLNEQTTNNFVSPPLKRRSGASQAYPHHNL